MTSLPRLFGVLLAFVLSVGTPTFALAQVSGSINGTMTDNTGAVLPGVTITVSGPALMGVQTTVSNEEGVYRFPTLPPGVYTLNYELAGFNTVVREGIVVQVGFTATIPVQMQVANLTETVTVSGASPVVDVQNTNIQNNFTAETLYSIPSARDIWSVIGLSPGVTVERFDVGGSRAGTQTDYQAYGLSGQVRVMADGANLTENTGGEPYFDFGAFEEVQLGTSSNDASMPTPGVMISTVIKSGGNELKGDIYFDYEHHKLQSRNVTDELRRLGVGEGSRITEYWDPNFNVGGPIKRDKFWYFVSFRGQRIGTTVTGFPIEAPGSVEFVTRLTGLTDKLSYQINQNNKLSQWMQFRRKEQPHRGASSTLYLDAVYKQDSISPYGGFDWHSVVTPTFFFNARFGTWGYNWSNFAYGSNLELNDNFNYRRTERITPSIESGSAYQDRNYRRRYQGDFAGTWFRDAWAGGDHTIKVGYTTEWEVQRNVDDGYLDEVRLRFDSPASANLTVPWRVSLYNTPTLTNSSMWHHGAYINDQINLSKKVTLNAGLRWDYYRGYVPEQNIPASRYRDFFYAGAPLANGYSIPATYPGFHADGKDIYRYTAAFGPRLGIAYDLFGNGKNVVKASWGRFYHNPGPDRAEDYNPIRNINFTFTWNDPNGDRLFTDNELGAFVSSSGSSADFIDPDVGQPVTDDVSVFFERELRPNLGARVGFVYKRNNNLYEDIEQARVGSLYTRARQFADPGPDGLSGTADDGSAFTVYDLPTGVTIPASVSRLETPDENRESYKTIEFMINKRMSDRWSLMVAAHHLWANDTLYGKVENPNEAIYNAYSFTNWAVKVVGTYQAPWGILLTPLLRHQSGDPIRRQVDVSLGTGTFDYTAEGFGKYRVDNPTIFDTKVEKRFNLGAGNRVGVFFEAFNITNSNAAEAADSTTGRRTTTVDGQTVGYPRFLAPTQILNPRVYRFGFRYEF
jgi:Carboxypeptidase regulatory-like domain